MLCSYGGGLVGLVGVVGLIGSVGLIVWFIEWDDRSWHSFLDGDKRV